MVEAPIHAFLEPDFKYQIRWLRPGLSKSKYLADPFGFRFEGKNYFICEFFDYKKRNARIVASEIPANGCIESLWEVIAPPHYISYPYVFEHENKLYCLPETSAANEVGLYVCDEPPYKWSKAGVLVSAVRALDPSIVNYQGRWWLLHGDKLDGSSLLYCSYADSLEGPWHPHALNPIKSDTCSSRPAGTLFVHEGRLYRPAQDCSRKYGGRIVINQVVELQPDRFLEEPVAFLEPRRDGPYPDGMHTISALGEVTLVDGKSEKFIFWALIRSIRRYLQSRWRPADQWEL